jgi:hypothetical protein
VRVLLCKDAKTRLKAAVKAIRQTNAQKAVAKEAHTARLTAGAMVSNAPLAPATGQPIATLAMREMDNMKASMGDATLMQLAEFEAACATLHQLILTQIVANAQQDNTIDAELV